MPHLPITAITAAILGLIYLGLSARVIQARGQSKISLGHDGGTVAMGEEHTAPLLVASRSHANFAEYVPLCLILIGFVEMADTRKWFVILLAALLIVGRVLHPVGMARKVPNPFRASGIVMTFTVMLLGSGAILVHAIRVAAQ